MCFQVWSSEKCGCVCTEERIRNCTKMKNSVDEETCMCTSTISEPETGKVSSAKPTQKGKNVLQKSPIKVPGMSYEITLTDTMNVNSSNHSVVLFFKKCPTLVRSKLFLLEISISHHCSSAGYLRCFQFHD